MRLAILDDEILEVERARQALETVDAKDDHSFRIYTFTSGQELLKKLRLETFDLLLLDWQLPDVSGLDVLLWIKKHLDIPPKVIMLTGRNDEHAVVQALSIGACDYIQKPFRTAELVARVNNALRHHEFLNANISGSLAYGNIVFDNFKQVAYREGVVVPLTPREYKLALLLFTNLDRPLSRQYFYDHLWTRDEECSSRSLDTHIYRIRIKLGLTADQGWSIETVYGYGYRLTKYESRSDA